MMRSVKVLAAGFIAVLLLQPINARAVSVSEYVSPQAAIDANPGKVIDLPAGDYSIDQPLRISADGTGLAGYGKIVQNNPEASILEIVRANGVRIIGVTLTRAVGREEALRHGIHALECTNLEVGGVQVIDNRSAAGTIFLERCRSSRVHGCTVMNYKRITIDDRTASPLYGYAFRVIDGTGILVNPGNGIMIQDNRVLENNLFPDPDAKEKYHLGDLTEGKQPTKKGPLAPTGEYANNWHQGSAIVVTSPEETGQIFVTGNYIENAAQGIDLHADHVTCSRNIIDYAFIGIKCMHGARNVIISENNISHVDLWGLEMQAGTASHRAEAGKDGASARPANATRGNLITNNIFSDFGYGREYFNWKGHDSGVISIETGPLPENPAVEDVIIAGNIVYDSGRDDPPAEGVAAGPRYAFAVYLTPDPAPRGLRFTGNIFHPGRRGVCNIDPAPFSIEARSGL